MKIVRSGECGNSPKNAFVEDFVIALFSGDDLSEWLAENVHLPAMEIPGISAITVSHAISHGRVGACNGVLNSEAGARGFAVMVEFANTKGDRIKRIDLYGDN